MAPDPAETETFTYDFLDRLTGVSGPYSDTYAYNQIGNITSRGGLAYTYGSSRPHAVTRVGTTDYTYDANGSMLTGDGRTITWDVENRPVQVVKAGVTSTFVYDGDGKRAKKTEGGLATLYLNKYYEKTGSEVTTSYYLGEKLVAIRKGSDLRYIHQDHLTGTALTTDAVGALVGSVMKYFPYGVARSGDVPTERKFTGQRLDSTGLYYYGARYYDPAIARFISADTIVQTSPSPFGQPIAALSVSLTALAARTGAATPRPANTDHALRQSWTPGTFREVNPQELNRYSYALSNPLRYVDPSGNHGQEIRVRVLLDTGWGGGGGGAAGTSLVAAWALWSALQSARGALVSLFGAKKDAIIQFFAGDQTGPKPSPNKDLQDVAQGIRGWIGEGGKVIYNDNGDIIIISADGTRRVRFDVNDPSPHDAPHGHVEQKNEDGRWEKSGPIYPEGKPGEPDEPQETESP